MAGGRGTNGTVRLRSWGLSWVRRTEGTQGGVLQAEGSCGSGRLSQDGRQSGQPGGAALWHRHHGLRGWLGGEVLRLGGGGGWCLGTRPQIVLQFPGRRVPQFFTSWVWGPTRFLESHRKSHFYTPVPAAIQNHLPSSTARRLTSRGNNRTVNLCAPRVSHRGLHPRPTWQAGHQVQKGRQEAGTSEMGHDLALKTTAHWCPRNYQPSSQEFETWEIFVSLSHHSF